jgi:hypothetical protein
VAFRNRPGLPDLAMAIALFHAALDARPKRRKLRRL